MDLKDIAAVSGKGGLFKVLKPTRTGVILETIDEQKSKLVANANSRVSLLKEISVYTTSKDASQPLETVFKNIFEKFGKSLKVNAKSEEKELKAFMEEVVSDYDTERVYISDIKKIVNWYNILASSYPEVFERNAEEVKEEPAKTAKESVKPAKAEKATVKAEKEEKKTSEKSSEEKPKAKAKVAAKKK